MTLCMHDSCTGATLCASSLSVFVLDLLVPPGDWLFMGTSVSHNEARKGDLCVNDLVCVHVFSFFFSSSPFCTYSICTVERLPVHELVSWIVSNQWWGLKCIQTYAEKTGEGRGADTEQRSLKKEAQETWIVRSHVQANTAPQINVGHVFHWDPISHREDKPHFQLSG